VVLTEHVHELGRLGCLGQGGEATQVSEYDGDLATVAAENCLAIRACADDQLGYLRWKIAPQAAETLELLNLVPYAGFERVIPPGQFGRLPLRRVRRARC
jgi:hypothetical protein